MAGINLAGLGSTPASGWYAYPALTPAVYPPHAGLPGWLRLIMWLALAGLWALASIRVLRPGPPAASREQRDRAI
jgi:hypothetical protein